MGNDVGDSPYDPWADIYDSVYSYVRSDIPFYMQLALESGGPVLELGVGTGRVAIPIAQLGVNVVGIDSSPAMLAVARRKLRSLNFGAGSLELKADDMRELSLADSSGEGRRFPLVTIPFRGFLALMTVEDQVRALSAIHRHLLPTGKLAFNIFVPDPNMALEQGGVFRHIMDVSDPHTRASHVLYQNSDYDTHSQIVSIRMRIEELDADGVVTRSLYRSYDLRYCYRWEVHHLLRSCGFEVEALYGDFDGTEFDEDSTEMIWVARKA